MLMMMMFRFKGILDISGLQSVVDTKIKKEIRPSLRMIKLAFKISLRRATFEQSPSLNNLDFGEKKQGETSDADRPWRERGS